MRVSALLITVVISLGSAFAQDANGTFRNEKGVMLGTYTATVVGQDEAKRVSYGQKCDVLDGFVMIALGEDGGDVLIQYVPEFGDLFGVHIKTSVHTCPPGTSFFYPKERFVEMMRVFKYEQAKFGEERKKRVQEALKDAYRARPILDKGM